MSARERLVRAYLRASPFNLALVYLGGGIVCANLGAGRASLVGAWFVVLLVVALDARSL